MIFWIEFIILVNDGKILNAAAANKPSNVTTFCKSLLSKIIESIKIIKLITTNHSSHSLGKALINFLLSSVKFRTMLFAVNDFTISFDLCKILISLIDLRPSLKYLR